MQTGFTTRRLMLEVAFLAVLLAPAGCTSRLQSSSEEAAVGWIVSLAWAAMLLIFRWAYRDFPNPFG
jgi:hypothetical protein